MAHFIYDHVSARQHRALDSITHAAKAGHWLAASLLVLAVATLTQHLGSVGTGLALLVRCSLAFIASLILGSIILHTIKLVLGPATSARRHGDGALRLHALRLQPGL